MKVLFLDIDGVCNCATTTQRHQGFIGIDPLMAFRIGKIQMYTDCKVVLSSSWRHFPGGKEEVEKRIVDIFDQTPIAPKEFRGEEVAMWLRDHTNVKKYAILDDTSDFYPDQPLFKTEWKTGITDEIMQNVIDFLNKE